METVGLVFLITKAATAGYVLLASVTALILLFYCRAFNKLTYRLFIYVLSATIVFSLAIEFDAVTVSTLSYKRVDNNDLQDNTSQITAALCAVSGAFIHYAMWLDILVIAWSMAWLVRMTGQTNSKKAAAEENKKTNSKQKICEYVGLVVLPILPLSSIIIPLGLSLYSTDGPWCYIRQMQPNITSEGSGASDIEGIQRDIAGLLVSLFTLYIPGLAVLLTSAALLVYTTIKMRRQLHSIEFVLSAIQKDLLKEGIMLGILLLIFLSVYLIWMLGYVYRIITLENNRALQFIEVAIFSIRGIAVFCTFLNPKTFTRIRQGKTKNAQLHSVSARRTASSDSVTVEGSFTLQENPNGEVNQNQIPHIRALPTREHA